MSGDRTPRPLLVTRFNESAPRLSPDGQWMAYVSNESGQDEVYVRPFPSMSGRWQVSSGGGTEPVWSRDGRELFYRDRDRLVEARVSASPSGTVFTVAGRRQLLAGRYASGGLHAGYDVHPDGQRFLMVDPVEDRQSIIVVVNWFADLRERIASARR